MQQFNGHSSQDMAHNLITNGGKSNIDTNYLQSYAKQGDLTSSRKVD